MEIHKLLLMLGSTLLGIGTAVLFFDLAGDRLKEKLNFLEIYQRKLKDSKDDLKRKSGPPGQAFIQGQDISDIEKLLIEAAETAYAENEKKVMELMIELDKHTDRHRRLREFATLFVLVGTVLVVVGSALDAYGGV